jgi:hypothetical protein
MNSQLVSDRLPKTFSLTLHSVDITFLFDIVYCKKIHSPSSIHLVIRQYLELVILSLAT